MINSPRRRYTRPGRCPGMDVAVRPHDRVGPRSFEVIAPRRLSHSGTLAGGGVEATHPDFPTRSAYHLSAPSPPPSPRCLPLPSSLDLLSSERAYQIVEVTFSPLNLIRAYQFSPGLFLPPANLFSRLTCEGRVKANEGKEEIISNIKIPLSKGRVSI